MSHIIPTMRASLNVSTARRAFSTTTARPLAKMQLIGRLAATPETTLTSGGKEIVKYSLATSYGPQDNRQTSWFRVAAFEEGSRKDLLLGLQKGTLIHVEADSRMRTYTDAEGKNRTQLDLVQRNLEILSRPRSAYEESEQENGDAAAA